MIFLCVSSTKPIKCWYTGEDMSVRFSYILTLKALIKWVLLGILSLQKNLSEELHFGSYGSNSSSEQHPH